MQRIFIAMVLCCVCIPVLSRDYNEATDSIPPNPYSIILLEDAPSVDSPSLRLDSFSLNRDSVPIGTFSEGKKKRLARRSVPNPFLENNFIIADTEKTDSSSDFLFLPDDCCDNLRKGYTELRTNPPAANTCVLTNPDVAGIFHIVDSGIPDGGTVIQDDFGQIWQRLFEPSYFKLCWWPEGTVVSQYDTIHSASEAFNLILSTYGAGSTIDLRAPGGPRTYIMDRQVILKPFTTVIGQGDTLRRIDAVLGVVESNVSAGEQYISLSNTSGFLKGQTIMVTRGRSNDDIVIPVKKLGAVTTTTIKVQGPLNENLLVGDTVITAFDMFSNLEGNRLGDIRFEGIIFDGNWRENPYTNAWGANNTVSVLQNPGSRLFIDRCGAFDIPSENFIGTSGRISNCHFKRLAGSIYHVSVIPDTAWNVYIENCWADSICLATSSVTGHSEAAIVTSAIPGNITISNCDFSHGREAVFGDLGGSVEFLSISGCKFRDFKYFIFGGIGEGNRGGEITGNYIENCSRMIWQNSGQGDVKYAIDWTISENEFINTLLDLNGLQSVKITNNVFRYQPSLGGFQNLVTNSYPLYPAMVHFSSMRNLYFSDNNLIGASIPNDTIQHGLLFSSQGNLPNDDLFIWERDVYVMNNTFSNFSKTISTVETSEPKQETPESVREYYNWNISGNSIKMLAASTPNNWGIYAAPGVRVHQNHIIIANDTISGSSYPILAMGIPSTPGNMKEGQIIGSIITNNIIEGIRKVNGNAYSIYIGTPSGLPVDQYLSNVVCLNNLTTLPIFPIENVPNKCQVEGNLLILPKRDLSKRARPSN
ncbi:MAG: hypothetical protein KDC34_00055 [Saprospiraceae bacterium]|nr:hypothetical protein [Saprospiraceae bacterium]